MRYGYDIDEISRISTSISICWNCYYAPMNVNHSSVDFFLFITCIVLMYVRLVAKLSSAVYQIQNIMPVKSLDTGIYWDPSYTLLPALLSSNIKLTPIGVATILSVGALFPEKLTTLFLSSSSIHRLKQLNFPLPISINCPPPPSKMSSQIWLALLWGALGTYPYKLRPQFFSALGRCTYTDCTPCALPQEQKLGATLYRKKIDI